MGDNGDRERDRAIEAYMPLAKSIAARTADRAGLRQGHWLRDEIYSDAMLALVLAYDKYRDDRGASLGTWLTRLIPREMFTLYRARAGWTRRKRESLEFYSMEHMIEDCPHDDRLETKNTVVGELQVADLRAYFEDLADSLYGAKKQRRAEIFKLCALDGLDGEKAGGLLGITRQAVSLHLIKARRQMRRIAKREGVI